MKWILRFISIETITRFIIAYLAGISQSQIQRIIDQIAAVANKSIDGIDKKNQVLDKIGDIVSQVIRTHGKWAVNFVIDLLVAMLRRTGKIN